MIFKTAFTAAVLLFASTVAAQNLGSFQSASVPQVGQYARFRGAPRNSNLAIYPLDGADFLVGQHFDISIELHNFNSTPSLAGLTTSISGSKFENFFNANWTTTGASSSWNFTYYVDASAAANKSATTVFVARYALRGVRFTSAGTYNASISIGSESVNATWTVRSFAGTASAKNLVLFIGDGMAPAMISAARYLSRATTFGKFKDNLLNLEKLGTVGKVITNGYDSIITDSANSASAYNTGHKGAVNALGSYTDTSSDTNDDPKLETLAEIIRRERPNMCIGVVTTSEIQDATPAAVWSHTRSRSDGQTITNQLLKGWTYKENYSWDVKPVVPDIVMGGGGAFFCATQINGSLSTYCTPVKDSAGNAVDSYKTYKSYNYSVVNTATDLYNYNGSTPLVGIFSLKHMDTYLDRNVYTSNLATTTSDPLGTGGASTDQPNLDKMVSKTLDLFDKKKCDGFFLMVEAASIDKSMHPLDFDRGLADLLEMDKTVKVLTDYSKANGNNTAIILTADHAQGYDVAGTIDLTLFNSQPNDNTGINVAKRRAVGTYQNAGWPDPVVDVSGDAKVWENRFRLFGSKVDSPGYKEDYKVTTKPPSTSNPLARVPTITNSTYVTNASLNITESIAVVNPNDAPTGLEHPPTLDVTSITSVHTLQAVDLYCQGPVVSTKCAKVLDNTEIFFIMAEVLALGSASGSSASSAALASHPVSFAAMMIAAIFAIIFAL